MADVCTPMLTDDDGGKIDPAIAIPLPDDDSQPPDKPISLKTTLSVPPYEKTADASRVARAASYFGNLEDDDPPDSLARSSDHHSQFGAGEDDNVPEALPVFGRASGGGFTSHATEIWRLFKQRSSVAIDQFLQQHHLQHTYPGHQAYREDLLSSRTPATTSSLSTVKSLSLPGYVWMLLTSFLSADLIKQKLSRLTFMEALEHFDLFNDLFFLVRVAWAIHRGIHWRENKSAKFVMAWLLITYFISWSAYLLRRFLIYHRINRRYNSLFYPFLVFNAIRKAGEESPEVLFMFERLCWTYQLLMRVIEDLPQVLLSILFLINQGRDTYAMLMISYSTTMFFITTIRMGLRYPFKGTLYLLLSSEPPIDDPVALEAAPTTYFTTLFMGCVFALWSGTYLFTLRYVSRVWRVLMIMLAVGFALLSLFCLMLFVYYRRQSAVNVDEAFLGNASQDDENQPPANRPSLVSEI
ncbi:insulin-degrading enzyme [Cystoisospora suis]|uniref:Insulin-degrading enzyme n=1 Tax=Cystoisospora suis TaxID=483139 RepID=A0A2C6KVF2_9APIC|nr:insulin-degrading enzyme [Cystoisospora suis]